MGITGIDVTLSTDLKMVPCFNEMTSCEGPLAVFISSPDQIRILDLKDKVILRYLSSVLSCVFTSTLFRHKPGNLPGHNEIPDQTWDFVLGP